MKIAIKLTKNKKLLLIEDWDEVGERIHINTDKQHDLFWLRKVKQNMGFYMGSNEEFKEYYKGIK